MKPVSIFFEQQFKHKCSTLRTLQTWVHETFSCFQNWKFILRFRDLRIWKTFFKKNTTVQLHTISKKKFQKCSNQWKSFWNKCVECFRDYHWLFISVSVSKVKLATIVEGDPKAPFSIATTPRCRGGRYSIPWIAPLYPWTVPYNAEC